jgi:hypothetical protein
VNLGGSKKIRDEAKVNPPLDFGVTLNPAYTLGDTAIIGLVGEVKYAAANDESKKIPVAPQFCSYLQHNSGAGHVVFGFRLGVTSQEGASDSLAWPVPLGINYSF